MSGYHSPLDAMQSDAIVFSPPRQDDAELDITPMIDITFLLLIFFLVASRIDSQASVELPPARNGELVSAKNSVILTVARDGDGVWVYTGDGIPMSPAEKAANRFSLDQETEIRQYIDAGLRGTAPFKLPMSYILVKAQRNLKQRDVDRVLKAAGAAPSGGSLSVAQLHVAVLEQQ